MLMKRVVASDGPTDIVSCTCDTERGAMINDLGASISSSATGTVPLSQFDRARWLGRLIHWDSCNSPTWSALWRVYRV